MVLLVVDPSLNAIAFEVPPGRDGRDSIWGKRIPTSGSLVLPFISLSLQPAPPGFSILQARSH